MGVESGDDGCHIAAAGITFVRLSSGTFFVDLLAVDVEAAVISRDHLARLAALGKEGELELPDQHIIGQKEYK